MDSGFFRRRWSFGETSDSVFWILDICYLFLFGWEMYLVLLINQKDYWRIKRRGACMVKNIELEIRDLLLDAG